MKTKRIYIDTPDGRYYIIGKRLHRKVNPHLPADVRDRLIRDLLDARRSLRGSPAADDQASGKARIFRIMSELGQAGDPWWPDDAPDEDRKLVENSSYKDWWSGRNARLNQNTSVHSRPPHQLF